MKIAILSLVLAVVAGVPVPETVFIRQPEAGNSRSRPVYFTLPLNYPYLPYGSAVSSLNLQPVNGEPAKKSSVPVVVLTEPLVEIQKPVFHPADADFKKSPTGPDSSQEIKLVLAIPVVPQGTSVSITVNVNSTPTGPVVSFGNPAAAAAAPALIPTSAPIPVNVPVLASDPGIEAVIVDANFDALIPEDAIKFPVTPGAEEIDGEEFREPPGFQNSKDSPVLISMVQAALLQKDIASATDSPSSQ